MMKKNYIYLLVLIIGTVIITFMLSNLYKNEMAETSYSYNNFNKITATEFDEYMIEHPDTIIYIADKFDLDNNNLEKNWVKKLEKLNLLENVIYIEKEEITSSLVKTFEEEYSFKYSEEKLPIIIVINDGKVIQTSILDENSIVDTVIDYEVFE